MLQLKTTWLKTCVPKQDPSYAIQNQTTEDITWAFKTQPFNVWFVDVWLRELKWQIAKI